jgi:GNAT superfamily N-acetyltransferase
MSVFFHKKFAWGGEESNSMLGVKVFGINWKDKTALPRLAVEKFGPIIKKTYKKRMTVDTVRQYLVLVYLNDDLVVGGMMMSEQATHVVDMIYWKTYHEAILPEYQNQGIGGHMFAAVKECAEESRCIVVDKLISLVENQDETAEDQIRFIKRQGFAKIDQPSARYSIFAWNNAKCTMGSECGAPVF